MIAFFLVGLSSSNESLVAVDLPVGVEVEDSENRATNFWNPGVVGLPVTFSRSPLPELLIAFRTQLGVFGRLSRNCWVATLRLSSSRAAFVLYTTLHRGWLRGV
jgi:hypothetical protein